MLMKNSHIKYSLLEKRFRFGNRKDAWTNKNTSVCFHQTHFNNGKTDIKERNEDHKNVQSRNCGGPVCSCILHQFFHVNMSWTNS